MTMIGIPVPKINVVVAKNFHDGISTAQFVNDISEPLVIIMRRFNCTQLPLLILEFMAPL